MLQYSYRANAPATPRTEAGEDQRWMPYSAIVDRPPLRWPNGARVALWICPNVLHYEFTPPPDPWVDSWARTPAPDVMMYGRQDYASRVGFWRVLDVLDKHQARCTAVLNADALRHNPSIRDAMVERGWSFLGHGIVNTRFTYGLSEREEHAYYREMIERVHAMTGVTMKGTGGPGPLAGRSGLPLLRRLVP
jgi:hypothetical protein